MIDDSHSAARTHNIILLTFEWTAVPVASAAGIATASPHEEARCLYPNEAKRSPFIANVHRPKMKR